jgi:hypothetical protein
MKVFSLKSLKNGKKSLADYKQDLLIKQGREQFKRLLEKGINVPVVLL